MIVLLYGKLTSSSLVQAFVQCRIDDNDFRIKTLVDYSLKCVYSNLTRDKKVQAVPLRRGYREIGLLVQHERIQIGVSE